MDNSNMGVDIELPPDFEITNDWDSHKPMLYWVVFHMKQGHIVEFGCGDGSTNQLWNLTTKMGMGFRSYETNEEWAKKFDDRVVKTCYRYMTACTDLLHQSRVRPAVVFIDCAPGELRKELIEFWRHNAYVIVVHDTEDGADYVYGMKEVLSSFKYRADLELPGHPRTTAVSMKEDLNEWKQNTVGGYKMS